MENSKYYHLLNRLDAGCLQQLSGGFVFLRLAGLGTVVQPEEISVHHRHLGQLNATHATERHGWLRCAGFVAGTSPRAVIVIREADVAHGAREAQRVKGEGVAPHLVGLRVFLPKLFSPLNSNLVS